VNTLSYRTISVNKESANKEWFVIDAENEILGRLSSKIATILRGKHKSNYTPHADCGDYVVVINAEKIRFTGKKMTDKIYKRYSGYPGGQTLTTPKDLLVKKPISIIEKGVKGMLPHNKLGDAMYRNLHVYAGTVHPHTAQQPKTIDLNTIK